MLWIAALLSLCSQGSESTRVPPALGARPPWVAWPTQTHISPPAHADRALVGVVSLATEEERVRIEWSFDDADTGERVFASQELATAFWPTAAVEVDGYLVLGGVRRTSGHTVLEIWRLEYPAPPRAESAYRATIASIESLYDEREPGRTGIRALFELRGIAPARSPQVLAHFVDSASIAAMELAPGGEWKTVVQAESLPALSSRSWKYHQTIEHPTLGFVYLFCQPLHGTWTGGWPVLVDSDEDGVIDAWHAWDPVEQEQRLGDPRSWVRVFDI